MELLNSLSRNTGRITRRGGVACLLLGILCGVLVGDEAEMRLRSGRAVGERVPQFYVRAVTGPLMNKSVCYVCRNGDRPVVMILLREIAPGSSELIKRIDRYVDGQRAVGLRGFCVLLTENQRGAVSDLQTMAFDHQLSIPLTVASPQLEGPTSQNIHPDAAVTVVLYHQQKVVATHAFRTHEVEDHRIESLMADVRNLTRDAQ